MGTLLHDVRYAIRQLRKSPGFTVTAVLTLALGIGATTAIFSIVDGVLLRPLPFRDPGQLVAFGDQLKGLSAGTNTSVTAPEVRTYTQQTQAFSSAGGYITTQYELSGAGEPAEINAGRLTAGVFQTLGVAPLLGHVFTQRDDEQNEQVAVLSYATWMSRFHGDRDILGKKLLLNRNPYLIIGVMPRSFEFPLVPGHLNQAELWVPMSFTQDELTVGASRWGYQMVARLKPSVTMLQAQQDANRVALEIMRNYPPRMAGLHISALVKPLQTDTVEQARPMVQILFLAVIVVLLVACANLAGLLLVRAIRRRRETAVRLAMGARPARLVRQTLLESLLLSVAGGLLGIALAGITIHLCVSMLPETLPRISDIHLNKMVAAFALSLAIATGILCGLAPAFAALRTNMNEALKEGGRTGSVGGTHARLRSVLVVSEIAVALILLIASGLLLRSFQKMRDVNLGFHPQHIVTASYSLPQKQYSTQAEADSFNLELLRRLQQLPGTKSAALTSALPMDAAIEGVFIPDGYVPPKGAALNIAMFFYVKGEFFRTMEIPLLHGRFFSDSDDADSQLVVIVNRKLAEHYWPGQDPIGKRIRLGMPSMARPWLTIVGEIPDVTLDAPDSETQMQFYQPVAQVRRSDGSMARPDDVHGSTMSVVLRTAMEPEQVENSLRATFHSLDPQLAITNVQSMDQAVSDSEAPRRFDTSLISAFGVISVLLAVLGIYSVIAFSVALRTQEMAIRLALGAPRSGVLRLILFSGAKLAGVGCVLGLAGALVVARLMRSLLFQVDPFDPLVVAGAAAAILMLALAASALPAQRAAAVDPMQALREE